MCRISTRSLGPSSSRAHQSMSLCKQHSLNFAWNGTNRPAMSLFALAEHLHRGEEEEEKRPSFSLTSLSSESTNSVKQISLPRRSQKREKDKLILSILSENQRRNNMHSSLYEHFREREGLPLMMQLPFRLSLSRSPFFWAHISR